MYILADKIYAMKVMNKNYIIGKKYLHYVVSEFEIIIQKGNFTNLYYINNIILFFAELILAIEHIHKYNIIYRNLKPENILLDSTRYIPICDFNLAKAGMPKDKRRDTFWGSPMYLSPEMLSGKGIDYRCNIYGIGVLMYELVTGQPAFKTKNIQNLYEKIKSNSIDFKGPGISGDFKDLIEKVLAKNPEERISLEEKKKHGYFREFDLNKVLKKGNGPIITQKRRISKRKYK